MKSFMVMRNSFKSSGSHISKYRNQKVVFDGHRFDSKRECQRYKELKLCEQAKLIKDLRLQVPFVLIEKSKHGGAIKYIADFVYKMDGQLVVEDVKGVRTPLYKLKKRLLVEKYGIEIQEV